jgi:hypothetical protein
VSRGVVARSDAIVATLGAAARSLPPGDLAWLRQLPLFRVGPPAPFILRDGWRMSLKGFLVVIVIIVDRIVLSPVSDRCRWTRLWWWWWWWMMMDDDDDDDNNDDNDDDDDDNNDDNDDDDDDNDDDVMM